MRSKAIDAGKIRIVDVIVDSQKPCGLEFQAYSEFVSYDIFECLPHGLAFAQDAPGTKYWPFAGSLVLLPRRKLSCRFFKIRSIETNGAFLTTARNVSWSSRMGASWVHRIAEL